MNVIRLIASRLITSIPIFTNRAMRTSYGKRPIINDGCPGRKEWLRAGEPATQKKRETTNGHECTRMKIDYSCLFVLIRGRLLLRSSEILVIATRFRGISSKTAPHVQRDNDREPMLSSPGLTQLRDQFF